MPLFSKHVNFAPKAQRLTASVCLSFLLLCIFATSHPAHADNHIIYVNTRATGANNGTSWANAFVTLQAALAEASAGDEIWVAAGSYYPDEGPGQINDAPGSTFMLKSGVALYGGFAGGETALADRDVTANLTVLSGDIDKNDTTNANGVVESTENIVGTNALHVVMALTVNAAARLDGFVITGGVVEVAVGCPDGCGGGIFVDASSPQLANLTLVGNRALLGGGLYARNSELTLHNTTFRNNVAASGGGTFCESSELTLNEGAFTDNYANSGAGGYTAGCTLNLTEITFDNNVANGDGGAIYVYEGGATLTTGNFTKNRAEDGNGGAVFLYENTIFTMVGGTFSSNQADAGNGGGIYIYDGNADLTGVTIENNSAHTGGGISSEEDSRVVLAQVTFADNTATESGGGLYTDDRAILTDVIFQGNRALENSGGGMFDTSSANLTNVTFYRNQADLYGGGLSANDATLNNVTFRQNHAFSGAGLFSGSTINLTNVVFVGNVARTNGGGMRTQGGSPYLTNVVFSGNRANNGGGLYNFFSSPTLTNVTFGGNQANAGGAIYNAESSSPAVQNTLSWGNTPNSIATERGIPTYTYSLIEGLNPDGPGNINGTNPSNAPTFMRPVNCGADGCGDDLTTPTDESANDDYGDLRVQPGSSGIDSGNNSANASEGRLIEAVPTDLAGKPRLLAATAASPVVDIGAYEAQPVAHAGGPYNGNEGSAINLNGSQTGNAAPVTDYAWDCTDDGTIDINSANALTSTCTYAQDGTYTVRLIITYHDTLTDTATSTVTVANVPPIFTPSGNQSTFAASAKLFALGSFTDPGAEEAWTVTVDWGDNTTPTEIVVNATGTLPTTSHTYAAAGVYNVLVTVSDGAASDDGGFQVQVNSAPPGAPLVSPPANQSATANIAQPFDLGSFTDEGSSGPWSVTVNWGDNSAETSFVANSSGTLPTQSHSYATVGNYEVLVTVSDGALATSASFRVAVTPEAGGDATPLYLPSVQRP